MSVEAISWALNLAPIPRDNGGKRNSACKAVLVGLANHAGPDGTGAFPSVRTLVRYTDLSERTVRIALDRLAAEGIIRACDPAIVAAKIKRADQRPQGWDLVMHHVRDDLGADDLTALETHFPGLTARVMALRAGGEDDEPYGVQPLHPVCEATVENVDNVTNGVQPLHPVTATGCSQRTNGVQRRPERGAAAAPEPSIEPYVEPSASAYAREAAAAADGEAAEAGEFFTALSPGWLLTARQRRRLTPAVAAALAAGWRPAALARFVGANTGGIRSPFAVLTSRLSPGELPSPPPRRARPPWCGTCDPVTRMLGYDGDTPSPCPRCKPPGPPRASSSLAARPSRAPLPDPALYRPTPRGAP